MKFEKLDCSRKIGFLLTEFKVHQENCVSREIRNPQPQHIYVGMSEETRGVDFFKRECTKIC